MKLVAFFHVKGDEEMQKCQPSYLMPVLVEVCGPNVIKILLDFTLRSFSHSFSKSYNCLLKYYLHNSCSYSNHAFKYFKNYKPRDLFKRIRLEMDVYGECHVNLQPLS